MIGREELVAADVHACEEEDRLLRVNPDDDASRERAGEIGVVHGDKLGEAQSWIDLHILHIGESLGLQQLFSNELGHRTDARIVDEPDVRRLGRGSAAADLGCRLRSPAVPASVNPPRNLRRLNR
jgi:hypothetical protein